MTSQFNISKHRWSRTFMAGPAYAQEANIILNFVTKWLWPPYVSLVRPASVGHL